MTSLVHTSEFQEAHRYMQSQDREVFEQIKNIKPGDITKLLARIDRLKEEIAELDMAIDRRNALCPKLS